MALPAGRLRGLSLRVALHGLGSKLIDVGEDCLSQLMLALDRNAGFGGEPADSPPGHPCPEPVGGLERIEAAPGSILTAAERPVHPPGIRIRFIASQKSRQRLRDALADPLTERSPQRPGVHRHLLSDGGDDLVGEFGEMRLDCGGRRWMQARSYADSIRNDPYICLYLAMKAVNLFPSLRSVTRLERNVNVAAVLIPPLGIAVSVPLLWGSALHMRDVLIGLMLYLITGFGVTIGYHRLLTHRAFATSRAMERGLALAGALALQGSPSDWVADHRKHHAHTDTEGDPHSPHVGQASGVRGSLRGLWHAHVGWLWRTQGQADGRKYAPELYEDPFMRAIHRRYHWLALATFVLPFLLGLALSGTWAGAVTGLLWGGLVRIFLIHHVTWSVNSVCHFFGSRRFALEDHSTNIAWLALPSLGEAWHHNHHAFARSAFHGLRRSESLLDPSGWVIRLMRRTHLAWNVIEISPTRQAAREQPSGREIADLRGAAA